MAFIETLAKTIRATDKLTELDQFVSEYLSIEVEGDTNTLVIASGESEIRINDNRIEISKDSLQDSARIVIDKSGHLTLSDAYGNSLTLAEIQSYLSEIRRVKDNQEDGQPYREPSAVSGSTQLYVQSLTVGTESNPDAATINAVQPVAGRAVFNLQAPANQTVASFLLRNSANTPIIAFRGGNAPASASATSPSAGAIAIGDGIGSVQNVVGVRQKGWVAASGTATRATFATSSVTTAQLAERVKALIDDLMTHGLIGS